MLVYEAVGGLILTPCPDRRRRDRLEHSESVQINGRAARAREMSQKGMSVSMPSPVRVGEVVRVTMPGSASGARDLTTPARVVHVHGQRGAAVVGLEFID